MIRPRSIGHRCLHPTSSITVSPPLSGPAFRWLIIVGSICVASKYDLIQRQLPGEEEKRTCYHPYIYPVLVVESCRDSDAFIGKKKPVSAYEGATPLIHHRDPNLLFLPRCVTRGCRNTRLADIWSHSTSFVARRRHPGRRIVPLIRLKRVSVFRMVI